MFKRRSYQPEYLDNLTLTGQALRDNLDEIEVVNRWLGGKKVFLSSLQTVYQRYKSQFHQRAISLLDIGCGNGDLLREANLWGQKHQLNIQASGIDANPQTIAYAREKSQDHTQIEYKVQNIFTAEFKQRHFDVVTMNLFCHHLLEKDLKIILENLTQQTRLAIIINDLHRHFLPYYTIKLLTRIFPCSYLIKNDAPLSVLKGFHKQELLDLLQPPITQTQGNSLHLNWMWPFRWQIIIWCQNP